jgi:hypothetical protein
MWIIQIAAGYPSAPAAGDGGAPLIGAAAQNIRRSTTLRGLGRRAVTLLMKREDVLVLKYLYEMGSDWICFASGRVYDLVLQPQPVWIRYILDNTICRGSFRSPGGTICYSLSVEVTVDSSDAQE